MKMYEKKRVARTYVMNMFRGWCAVDEAQLEGAMFDAGFKDLPIPKREDYSDIADMIAEQIELLIRRYDVKGGK